MFGFISKKKLKKYIDNVKAGERANKNGQNYDRPISEEQQKKNIYLQGYEDGTNNFYNAVCAKFKIKRSWKEQQ